jgi:hypothetical protein
MHTKEKELNPRYLLNWIARRIEELAIEKKNWLLN